MVTGSNDFESIEKAMMLGAVDYITKPFTVQYLEETVDSKIAAHLIYA
jgi:response regulator of citrate/malate metabolism